MNTGSVGERINYCEGGREAQVSEKKNPPSKDETGGSQLAGVDTWTVGGTSEYVRPSSASGELKSASTFNRPRVYSNCRGGKGQLQSRRLIPASLSNNCGNSFLNFLI